MQRHYSESLFGFRVLESAKPSEVNTRCARQPFDHTATLEVPADVRFRVDGEPWRIEGAIAVMNPFRWVEPNPGRGESSPRRVASAVWVLLAGEAGQPEEDLIYRIELVDGNANSCGFQFQGICEWSGCHGRQGEMLGSGWLHRH